VSGHSARFAKCHFRKSNILVARFHGDMAIRAHLSLGRLTALVVGIACRSLSPRSRNIGLGSLPLLCDERIEIDELRIVLIGIAMEPSAAMNVHQGLHTPSI
jgi:hypothetical protein